MCSYICVYPAHCSRLGRRPHSLVFVEKHGLLVMLICLILFALAVEPMSYIISTDIPIIWLKLSWSPWYMGSSGSQSSRKRQQWRREASEVWSPLPTFIISTQISLDVTSVGKWATKIVSISWDASIDWCLNISRAVLWSDRSPALEFWDAEDSEETPTKN